MRTWRFLRFDVKLPAGNGIQGGDANLDVAGAASERFTAAVISLKNHALADRRALRERRKWGGRRICDATCVEKSERIEVEK